MKDNKIYMLYSGNRYGDNREYLVIVFDDGKRYGYLKEYGKVKRQNHPYTSGMKFIAYITREKFEELIFVDSI